MSTTIPDQRPPSQRRSSLIIILSAVMAVLLIIAGIISFFISHNNQVAQDHIHATHATATVVQKVADNHATAVAVSQQNATATAIAIPGLTATAIATSPYTPFTKVSFDNPLTFADYFWNVNSACQFSAGGYQVSDTQPLTIQYCNDMIDQYSEMAYQVKMTIHAGDCGGLVFGYNDVDNLYIFEVCQGGTYNVYDHLKGVWTSLYADFHASSVIKQGLNVQNSIAVTSKGNIITLYVNGKQIDTAKDLDLIGDAIRKGHVGLFADNRGDATSVTYNNALVWTM